MNRRLLLGISLGTLGLLASTWAVAIEDDGPAPLEIGKRAPRLRLKDLDGKVYKLSKLKGKIVVLEWMHDRCDAVKHHQTKAKTMVRLYEKYKDEGVVWLAIDSNQNCERRKAEIKKYAEKNDIPYPILLDAAGTAARIFRAKLTPHMFIIDKKGKLAYRGAVDSDETLEKTDSAENYVEKALDALLAGSKPGTTTTEPYGCKISLKPLHPQM